MRISDWSSDVCSSDLAHRYGVILIGERAPAERHAARGGGIGALPEGGGPEGIGRGAFAYRGRVRLSRPGRAGLRVCADGGRPGVVRRKGYRVARNLDVEKTGRCTVAGRIASVGIGGRCIARRKAFLGKGDAAIGRGSRRERVCKYG